VKIHIEIDTSNAAFDDAPCVEVARMLHILAARIGQYPIWVGDDSNLRDANGNKVGRYWVADDES